MVEQKKLSKESEVLGAVQSSRTHTVSVDYALRFCSEFVDYVAGRGGAYLSSELEDDDDSDLAEISFFPKRKFLPPKQFADLTDTYRQATRLLAAYFGAEASKMEMAEVTLDTVSSHFRKNVTIENLLAEPILVHNLIDAGCCEGRGEVATSPGVFDDCD